MQKDDKTNLLIYRHGKEGLEVFLVNDEENQGQWSMPKGNADQARAISLSAEEAIELDPVEEVDGVFEQAYAVEADWHDIPSIKSILKHDAKFMKKTIKQMVPDMMSKGAFVAVKEAFKKVLPHQYKQIKELKEILIEKNSTKYM
jgi:predicted NUDIX family NTP pyrophosphohydrolase